MLLRLLILVLAIAAVNSFKEQKELEGAKAYKVTPLTRRQQGFLHSLQHSILGVDFDQYAIVEKREARVIVSKDAQKIFESLLKLSGVPFEVYMNDVKRVAEQEMLTNEIARLMSKMRSDSKISFDAYNTFDEINAYLDTLQGEFSETVTVKTIGNSAEGRAIKAIIISTNGGTDTSKPVFLADAGIHAREWIAPAQALYMIRKLVEDITESDLVEKMDWVIIPLLNPDGYEHSRVYNRFWRKTRSTFVSILCPGVDPNRNFDFQWMVSGTSANPCSDIYAGPNPFSEIEVRHFRDLVQEYKGREIVYMAIHSHGSLFLYPFAYNGEETADNEELHTVGLQVAEAIDEAAVEGSPKYIVGNVAQALNYNASGGTVDWTYAIENIKLSYVLELPSGGDNGFDLPPNRIDQVVKETWRGIIVLARYVIGETKNKLKGV